VSTAAQDRSNQKQHVVYALYILDKPCGPLLLCLHILRTIARASGRCQILCVHMHALLLDPCGFNEVIVEPRSGRWIVATGLKTD
jgi:hypothetical protein